MYYGDEIVENVREHSDIVDLIKTYVNLKRAGSNYVGLCPFHNEKTPSFSVSPTKQIFYCVGCHKGGDIYTFLQEYENMTFSESVQFLAGRAGITLPEGQDTPENRKQSSVKEQLFKINAIAGKFYYGSLHAERGKPGMEYLRSRGVSDEMMKKFALGFASQSGGLYLYMKQQGYNDDILSKSGLFVYDKSKEPYDKFWNRVMYPIVDRRNHVIGFGGRVMGDGKPKYMNSPETVVFDKSKNLYGINYIHGKLPDGIILCEGYMDVIALHQAGYTNAVAALGTAFTPGHASLIKRMTDHVYLCFDGDGAGVSAAMKAIPVLKEVGIRAKVIDLSPHKDPDEFFKALSVTEFEERIKKSRNSFFFETDIISREYDMDDPERKTQFMNVVADRIVEFEDEIERSNYIDAFSREYGVRSEDFRALVVKQSAKRVGMERKTKSFDSNGRGNMRSVPVNDAKSESQGILLSWLCDNPDKYSKLKNYVAVTDFVDEPYHSIATVVYDQLEQTGQVNAAAIISQYNNPDEQSLVAGIFHSGIVTEGEGEEHAIQDVIRVVLRHSIDHRSANAVNIDEVQKLFQDKKRLQQLVIDIS
ncbi:MAG: DNA primase [Eubacterium sp.]|nr:DNA primase [Eubacterium sp.]